MVTNKLATDLVEGVLGGVLEVLHGNADSWRKYSLIFGQRVSIPEALIVQNLGRYKNLGVDRPRRKCYIFG